MILAPYSEGKLGARIFEQGIAERFQSDGLPSLALFPLQNRGTHGSENPKVKKGASRGKESYRLQTVFENFPLMILAPYSEGRLGARIFEQGIAEHFQSDGLPSLAL